MGKSRFLSILFAAALTVSCAPSISRSGEYGSVSVNFSDPSARERTAGGSTTLETGWPGDVIPAFSSVTVTVSAPDMSTVTAIASGSSGNLTVRVLAGTDRLVEVTAVPATGAAPMIVKAYGGSAVTDVAKGETKNLTIKLEVSGTKFLLPGSAGELGFPIQCFDSLTGITLSETNFPLLTPFTQMPWDRYGRLYGPLIEGILQFADPSVGSGAGLETPELAIGGLAFDLVTERLYFVYSPDGEAVGIGFVQVGSDVVTPIDVPDLPDFFCMQLAARDSALYVTWSDEDASGVRKLAVGTNGATTTLAYITTAALGTAPVLDYTVDDLFDYDFDYDSEGLVIQDMVLVGETLYLAVSQVYDGADDYGDCYASDACSHGKVVALDAETLAVRWQVGLGAPDAKFPTDPNKQFYGPRRFVAVSPKKLYVADDGFSWDGILTGGEVHHYTDVDRVIELDAETGAFSFLEVDDQITFFESFSEILTYDETYSD